MTVSNNSMMASQVYANKDVQAKSGASGTWTGASATQSSTKSSTFDKAEFSQAALALAKNVSNSPYAKPTSNPTDCRRAVNSSIAT